MTAETRRSGRVARIVEVVILQLRRELLITFLGVEVMGAGPPLLFCKGGDGEVGSHSFSFPVRISWLCGEFYSSFIEFLCQELFISTRYQKLTSQRLEP
jgi:hypothetical protein